MKAVEVLLAGAVSRPGLSAARSLSKRGVPFVALGNEPRGMIAASRHVRRYVEAPSPVADPDGFLQAVTDAVSRFGVRVVMPIVDASLGLLNRHREDLPNGALLAAAPRAAVENVLDKRRNLETARRLGIPCPDEAYLESVDHVVERLGFPLVLKSAGFVSGEATRADDFKWAIADDRRELEELLERHSFREPPLCQELVRGTVRNLCCFAAAGTVVAMHEYVSLRRLGWEGTGVLREITPLTPALADHAERLLGELRWEGVAQVAFILGDGGQARYMETNGRLWGSVEGSIRMGWDFPYWAYRYFTAGEMPTPPPARIGSKACWHFGDLRLLGRRLRNLEPPPPPPGKLQSIAGYLAAFRPGVHSDVFAFDDPLPELVEHGVGLKLALARRLGRTRREAKLYTQ